MNTQRKLLVLGSDFGTLDLVREAHRMGLYVIVADLMETSPTKQEADEAWLVSTTNLDLLEAKCRENNVSGVITGASDFNTSCSRHLCKRLGLSVYCPSDKAWEIGRNKRMFKDLCKECGAPIAKDYILTDKMLESDLDSIRFPVVVKPVDKSGNRGMSYCQNKEELIAAYKYARSISDNETIIVEKELHGPEFAAHYLVADGHARLLWFGSEHNQPGEKSNLYSLVCTTGAYLKQYLEEVNDQVIKVFEKAECSDGIVWVECIRDDDEHFYLFEMGYRFGGTMLYTWFEKVSGINSIRWMIDCALGNKHRQENLPAGLNAAFTGVSASYHLFSNQEGIVQRIVGLDEISGMENVIVDIPKRGGHKVSAYSCIGIIRIYGKDIDDLCHSIRVINSLLRVENVNGDNMVVLYDDYSSLRDEYLLGLRQYE